MPFIFIESPHTVPLLNWFDDPPNIWLGRKKITPASAATMAVLTAWHQMQSVISKHTPTPEEPRVRLCVQRKICRVIILGCGRKVWNIQGRFHSFRSHGQLKDRLLLITWWKGISREDSAISMFGVTIPGHSSACSGPIWDEVWSGNIWLWTICLSLLDHLPCISHW